MTDDKAREMAERLTQATQCATIHGGEGTTFVHKCDLEALCRIALAAREYMKACDAYKTHGGVTVDDTTAWEWARMNAELVTDLVEKDKRLHELVYQAEKEGLFR